MTKIIKVKCPQCDTPFSYYESESRPFCSERCKQIDLGHWFQESYVVPAQENNTEPTEIAQDADETNESDYEH